ncbi:Metallo-dependent hydrolase [Gigaspora margarita]|uniref:Metallo-dependent hydrolase n=1 Tax=Gigaspora margarita TaxID=4874 RepID=A0A8H4AQC6_GIGMA|nr:Metallo-dependent hydrolase [Gigaspora margarita]
MILMKGKDQIIKIVESVLDNMEDLVHKGVMVNLGVLSQFYNHHQIQIYAHSLNINLGYLGRASATAAQAESKRVLVINAMAAMGLPPGDYILGDIPVVETATLHPSELLGIQNIKRTLNIGAKADLIFLDDDLKVMKFFIAGEKIDI